VVVFSGRPDQPVDVPAVVAEISAGRPISPVWSNEVGGVTFEVGTGARRCFVKWSPLDTAPDLAPEVARLRWAGEHTPVPRVLAHGRDELASWMVTAALPGGNAVEPRWKADPATAVAAIGRGLRTLHDALPVANCPFSWSAADRASSARRRAANLDPAAWDSSHTRLSPAEALELVDRAPPPDRLVVCHGDACAPNTLLTDDGVWSGHVDLGSLGVADRWADLAVATWSTAWNYGPGWERPLLDAYGIEPDPERTAYYRLLWDLGP
jgi:kanamycin kinase